MPDSEHWQSDENYKFAEETIKSGHFDAIIYQDSYAPTQKIICPLARKYGVPLYIFEHNTPLYVFKAMTWRPILSLKGIPQRIIFLGTLYREIRRKRYLLKYANKYVLLSSQYIPELCKLIGIKPGNDKLTYINNPILPLSDPIDEEKENIILCVCQVIPRKRVNLMLKMWERMYAKYPDWKFQIVGDGTDRQKLEQYVEELNIPRVEFTGYAKPQQYYRKAKIFWMTSSFEGWGMTLIESMQCGCVPIAYDTFSSIYDIIVDGNNGYIVGNLDSETFIAKSEQLMQDCTLFNRMSSQAKAKAATFEIDSIIQKWYKLLKCK